MSFVEKIRSLLRLGMNDDARYDELADLLVEGDIGPSLAVAIAEELKASSKVKRLAGLDEVRLELKAILLRYGMQASIMPSPGVMSIFLVLGVNGVGKTTTCAKLADFYRRCGIDTGIILAAGDTFRAAAIDQLKIHGERLGMRVVAQKPGSDPAAVLWDAIDAARAEGAGIVIADTAGRMHTRADLVRELGKIDRIVSTRVAGADYRRLLVIDSTTGQNGLRQAETFSQAVKIDGIVLTKHDSTAKGGMAIRLARELRLPTAFIGTGEGYRDIEPFVLEGFIDRFLGIGS